MDYRNNPRHDREIFIKQLRKQAMEYIANTKPHNNVVCVAVPEFDLSPDSIDLYKSFSSFLSANRRRILEQFSKFDWPYGVVVQLAIDYEARLYFSWYDSFLIES